MLIHITRSMERVTLDKLKGSWEAVGSGQHMTRCYGESWEKPMSRS